MGFSVGLNDGRTVGLLMVGNEPFYELQEVRWRREAREIHSGLSDKAFEPVPMTKVLFRFEHYEVHCDGCTTMSEVRVGKWRVVIFRVLDEVEVYEREPDRS